MFKSVINERCQKKIQEMLDTYKEANQYLYTDDLEDKKKYVEVLNRFYKKEAERRTRLLIKAKSDPEFQKTILRHLSRRENIISFMIDWCWTYDPRNPAIGLPASIPWIPFPRQIEFIDWFYNLYLNQQSGLVEKSRDMGITWIFVLISSYEWLFSKGFSGGIGSNKLDNVDKPGEPDCIFEKIRMLLKLLPKFMMPPGFRWNKHDKKGNIINPDKRSQIGGQGGLDIGRGGRKSFYLVDEAASLEAPLQADSALSGTTKCQIDLSTPKGMNHFGIKRHSGRVPVFTFNWRDDPRKDQRWYDAEKKRLDPVVLAQEVDINYHASVAGLFIKPEWVEAAINIVLKPSGDRQAGLDVAAGGTNKSSLAFAYGPVVLVKQFDIPNGSDLTHETIDLCNAGEIDVLHYDAIGVGYAVESVVNRTEKEINFTHYGLKASNSPSDLMYPEFGENTPAKKIFFNARTEWWYRTARMFEKTYEHYMGIKSYEESELISIENDGNLKAQLCSVRKMYTETGKMKAESKESLLKRGVQSPDSADALILSKLPRAGGEKRILSNMNNLIAGSLEIDWANLSTDRYKVLAGFVLEKDLSCSFLGTIWDSVFGKLQIFTDEIFPYPEPSLIAKALINKLGLNKIRVEKLIGNDKIFDESKRTFHRELNKSLFNQIGEFQNAIIRPPKKYDQFGSTSFLLKLVKNKKIEIDVKCKSTISQFYDWKLEKSEFKSHGLQTALLLVISELVQSFPYSTIERKLPEYRKVETPTSPIPTMETVSKDGPLGI